MSEEILDLVDENNNPTGESAPRSRVHAEGLWHRTVHIYLFRKNENDIDFLVHLRSKFKDLNPNKWDTRFGGHLKSGTTVEEGVKAELKEEIGIDVALNELIQGVTTRGDKFPNREFTKTFYLKYEGDLEDLKFDDGEVQKVEWMNMEEIKKSITENPDNWSADLTGFEKISNYLINKLS